MDNQKQPSEVSQQSLPKDELSSKSELLQLQRLFRHISCLTVLLGIMIGICLALFVEVGYVLAGNIPYAFYPTSPIVYRLLSPLMIISMGMASIIAGKLTQLRKQHPMFKSGRFDPLDINATWPSSLIYGLFVVWCGGFGVLALVSDPDAFWGKSILLLWVIGGVGGLAAILLMHFFKKRRIARR